ncbi:hypothetical protein CBL_01263 [Carabus blaptoides fortunei]
MYEPEKRENIRFLFEDRAISTTTTSGYPFNKSGIEGNLVALANLESTLSTLTVYLPDTINEAASLPGTIQHLDFKKRKLLFTQEGDTGAICIRHIDLINAKTQRMYNAEKTTVASRRCKAAI